MLSQDHIDLQGLDRIKMLSGIFANIFGGALAGAAGGMTTTAGKVLIGGVSGGKTLLG